MGDEAGTDTSRQGLTRRLFGLAAVVGILIIVLSFAPWVEFTPDPEALFEGTTFSFSLDGTELSRLRGPDYQQPADISGQEEFPCSCRSGFGDGYIVALMGLLIVAAAVAGIFLRGRERMAATVVIVAALIAFAVAGYNATGIWQGAGARSLDDPFVLLDGDVRAELIALTVLSGVAAVMGAVVWSLLPRGENDYVDDEELAAEDAEAWA
jgi:hypothetical protein